MIRPPLLARALVSASADRVHRDAQLGDLEEEFHDRAAVDPAAARRWYWRQVVRSVGPNLAHRIRRRPRRPSEVGGMVGMLWQNLRFSTRAARKHPGFAVVAVGTLALGIGVNTTLFGAVHGLILSPFPFPEPDRIVGVGTVYPRLGQGLGFFENLSPAEYVDVLENAGTLEEVVAWDMGNRQIAGEGPPQNVFTGFWWGDALRTLGMRAHLGRGFEDDEIARGDPVALLSHRIWRDRFGADSTLVGTRLLVNGAPHTLVGILPEGVVLYGMDLWTVMPVGPEAFARNRRQFQVLARVREGVGLREVNAELEGIARRNEQAYGGEFPEYEGWSLEALRWNEVSSRTFRAAAFVVSGAAAFVLLLVCANTANLLLARAPARRREMAVRTALGASRARLVGQLLTESLVLAGLGGVLGAGLAVLGAAGIRSFLATLALPVAGAVEVDGPVLAFAAAVAGASGLLFGLAPAFQAARTGPAGALQAENRAATAGPGRQRLQRAIVGAEVALAFVLLSGGGLLVNSFLRLSRVEPGFEPERVLSMRLTLPREEYAGDAVPAFFRELAERVEALPGVRSAAAGSQFPPIAFSSSEVRIEDGAPAEDAALPRAFTTVVTRGYFETLGMPLRAGRTFDATDSQDTPAVAVINETAARRFYPDGNALGKRLALGGAEASGPWFEIVGVVGSTRNRGLDRPPEPEVFGLHDQIGGVQNQLFLLLRTDVDPRSLLPAVRAAVAGMDPDQPVYAVQTVEQAFATAVSARRATTVLLTAFAGFALLLAALGVYAVVSWAASRRTREIGLRVALGADAGRVRRMVVRQALVPVLAGAGVGVALTVPLGVALRSLLFEVTGTDPPTLAAVAALLVGVAAVASFVPAWRASRVDPAEALRTE